MLNNEYLAFLEGINPLEVIEKISKFRSLNISEMSPTEANNAIYDVLTVQGKFIYFTNNGFYAKGTLFYRARMLDSSVIPNPELMFESDFWNPPAKLIKEYGRLNKPGETLLYTTPGFPEITLKEIKIPDDRFYALMVYEATEDIKVNIIGKQPDYETLGISSKNIELINNIYNDFLKDEFSRDVGEGTEYLYIVSELIAKNFFDLPPRVVQDGWAYPSLKDKEKYNVCFRPEIAKEVLNLKGSLICKKIPQSYGINVRCIQSGFDGSGKAQFHELGSSEQQKIFPEIKATEL